MMQKGKFISFEGLDGAGKTTQVKMLAEWMADRGIEYVGTREPGGTLVGMEIRNLILNPIKPLDPMAEAFLFAADRAQHFKDVVIPALKRGEIVICDRCFDSSIAYQGYVRGVGSGFVEHLSSAAMRLNEPHLTILLDLPPDQVALRKNTEDASRFDKETVEFHTKLRAAFLARAKNEHKRIKVVDATQSVEAIHGEIVRLVKVLLPEAGDAIDG
jgi:dTMP kinase